MNWNYFDLVNKYRTRLSIFAGLFFIVVLISTALGAPKTPQEDTLVRCEPVNSSVPVGSTFSFDIYIQDVEELSGADVQLSFDPDIVKAVDADPSANGVQMQLLDEFLFPDFVLRNVIDSSEGTIWYAAVQINSPGNPREPANGSGPLARVTFEAIKEGMFDMPITYAKLSTPDGFSIPFTAVGCSVTVSEVSENQAIFMPVILSP